MLEPQLSTFDPDFDSPAARRPQLGDSPLNREKRLVVNPFLVVLDWLIAFALFRAAIAHRNFTIFQIGAVLLLSGFFLLQYHCLDCGTTGWLIRHRSHTCHDDVVRWRPPRFRVPSVGTQIVVWCYLVAAAVLLLLILARR
jgi:hypothetical protein